MKDNEARDRVRGKASARDSGDRYSAAIDRIAEIALQHQGKPFQILHPDRLIEAEFFPKRLGSGGIADIEQQGRKRVARHRTQHEEHQRRDRPHHDEGAEQTAGDIAAHVMSLGRSGGHGR